MAKWALITGGSSGIGKAIAEELGKRGWALLLVSKDAGDLELCAGQFQEKGILCRIHCMDLARTEAASELYRWCNEQQISPDMLVNNAGLLVFGRVAEVSDKAFHTISILHQYTPAALCRLFGRDMMNKKHGYILNISSISAVMPYPGISLYGPGKTFIRAFSKALRYEMQPEGVHVCCVLPGATETALYDPERVNLPLARRLGVMHSPEFVARKAVEAALAGRAECIPGLLNKITVVILPWIPAFVIRLIYRNTAWVAKGSSVLG